MRIIKNIEQKIFSDKKKFYEQLIKILLYQIQ